MSESSERQEETTSPDNDIQALKGKPWDISGMPESAWESESTSERTMRICGVRFGDFGRVFSFNCEDLPVEMDTPVIAEVQEKGLMLGYVARPAMTLDTSDLKMRLRKVLRVANEDDLQKYESTREAERLAHEKVQSWIKKLKLQMHLLRVEYTLDRHKVIVYFSAENRVDFRELLRELIRDLQSRVELRQIGVRDQAKERGAIGPCGEETCCSRHITKFSAVSIKMARDQNLSLTPTKVSGNCGRLKCCLAYEHPIYQEESKKLPRKGKCVKCKSSGSCGTVRDVDILKGELLVQFDDGKTQMIPASEVVEVRNRNEKIVATTDEKVLQGQIDEARENRKENRKSDDSRENRRDAKSSSRGRQRNRNRQRNSGKDGDKANSENRKSAEGNPQNQTQSQKETKNNEGNDRS